MKGFTSPTRIGASEIGKELAAFSKPVYAIAALGVTAGIINQFGSPQNKGEVQSRNPQSAPKGNTP